MPSRNRRWVWAGRGLFLVIVAGLVGYLVRVGLDRADKLASSIGVVVALAALAAPYLLPVPKPDSAWEAPPNRVEESGPARASGGGQANSGVDAVRGDQPAHVVRSGEAIADGPGSVANTGVQRRPRP